MIFIILAGHVNTENFHASNHSSIINDQKYLEFFFENYRASPQGFLMTLLVRIIGLPVKNCLISPFFLGPLHMTASSLLGRRKPIDMTAKLSSK